MFKKFKPCKSLYQRSLDNTKKSTFVKTTFTSVVRQELPYEVLTRQELPNPNDNVKCVRYLSDVYLLLNQNRLDRLSLQAFSEYLSSLPQSQSTQLDSIRKKVSDDALLQLCKSRHIQSASELIAWSHYLTNQAIALESDVKDYALSIQQQTVDNQTQETSNSE